MTKALIAGSFDPITIGHLDLIKRASNIFDEVYVVEFVNPDKKHMFDDDERLEMIKKVASAFPNVIADSSFGLSCDYCVEKGISVFVRGVRNTTDYEYETTLFLMNREVNPDIETMLLPASPELSAISSSFVREMVRYGRDFTKYVPDGVGEMMKKFMEIKSR